MKAISPVIATVIIVAVAIAIAVAVAFWMTGITGTFTRYEKLEITYAYATKQNTHWEVVLKVQNTGPSDATIDDIFINGKPLSAVTDSVTSYSASGSDSDSWSSDGGTVSVDLSIPSGQSLTLYLYLEEDGFDSGQTVEIKIHTAAGNEYPKQVTLP